MLNLLRYKVLISKLTIGPAIAPAVTYLPPGFKISSNCSQLLPATKSTTTSNSLVPNLFVKFSFLSTTSSAPIFFISSNFDFEHCAITKAPLLFANCIDAEPTPPEAPDYQYFFLFLN